MPRQLDPTLVADVDSTVSAIDSATSQTELAIDNIKPHYTAKFAQAFPVMPHLESAKEEALTKAKAVLNNLDNYS